MWLVLCTITVTLILGIITFMKWKLKYWENLGVPTLPSSVPFGNAKDLILGNTSFGLQFYNLYQNLKPKGHKFCGFYLTTMPVFVPLDPELIKHIMQIDFGHFNSHGGFMDEETDPLSVHLFNLEDAEWGNLRVKMTPTFTSGKMKMMFHTLADVSKNLVKVLNDNVDNNEAVDAKDILNRFGVDVISSVAFGLECDSLNDPNVPFAKYGKRASTLDVWDNMKIFLQVLLPKWLLHAMGHKFTKSDVEAFFMKTIEDTVEYRESQNVYRKDFMHLLLQLKNRGVVADDDQITDNGQSKEVALTFNQLAAQAYIFFMAGYETSSTTLSFALYELATNPEIQNRLRQEVNTILAKFDGTMTYEGIMEMTYMDKVINEALRKYPPLPILTRLCTKNYTIPNTEIEIKKGQAVMIPVLGIQRDPEYYPAPEIFDPERFSEENKQARPSFTWLPFGDGPRICIGMRFGMLQSKIALCCFLRNFEIRLNEKTITPIEFDKREFVSRAKGGVWLDLTKISY